MKQETKCYCGHTTYCDCGSLEEPKQHVELINDNIKEFDKSIELFKQETLEEAAVINYKKLYEGEPLTQDAPIDAFKQGAKWKQKRSYSDEEVLEILASYSEWSINGGCTYSEWFEQFKKI